MAFGPSKEGQSERSSRGSERSFSQREDLRSRTNADEIDRRHDWNPEGLSERGASFRDRPDTSRRSFGGGSPGGYGYGSYAGPGSERGLGYGAGTYGDSGGYGPPSAQRGGYNEPSYEVGGFDRGYAAPRESGYASPRESGHGESSYGPSYPRGSNERYRGGEGGSRPGRGFGGERFSGRVAPYEGSFAAPGRRRGGESSYAGPGFGREPTVFGLHSAMSEGYVGERSDEPHERAWRREGPLVRDLMTRSPKTVHLDASVAEAAKLMREEDTGIIPVVEDEHVKGVVTDRDLSVRVLAMGKDGASMKVREVMSDELHTAKPDDRVRDVVRHMGEKNVRRMPVVDREGRLRGILSMSDVAREAENDPSLQQTLWHVASRRSFWSRW